MDFSPDLKTNRRIKTGITCGIISLLGVGVGLNCRTEKIVSEDTKHLVNSIKLGTEKGDRFVTIAGELEVIGGSWGGNQSNCHYDLRIDKERPGYTPVLPIRVVVRFHGNNDSASRKGEKFNAIVTGVLKKEPNNKSYKFKIDSDDEGNSNVGIRRMWFWDPL